MNDCLLTQLPDTLFIKDTVEFYFENPEQRALHDHGKVCQYLTSDGRMCAVGRAVPQETLRKIAHLQASVQDEKVMRAIDEDLKDVKVNYNLLGNLQRWHDATSTGERGTTQEVELSQLYATTYILEALSQAATGPDVEIFVGTFPYTPRALKDLYPC